MMSELTRLLRSSIVRRFLLLGFFAGCSTVLLLRLYFAPFLVPGIAFGGVLVLGLVLYRREMHFRFGTGLAATITAAVILLSYPFIVFLLLAVSTRTAEMISSLVEQPLIQSPRIGQVSFPIAVFGVAVVCSLLLWILAVLIARQRGAMLLLGIGGAAIIAVATALTDVLLQSLFGLASSDPVREWVIIAVVFVLGDAVMSAVYAIGVGRTEDSAEAGPSVAPSG